MNTPSPLIPQGTLPARKKSNVCFNILTIIALHVVVIGGLLLQGCGDHQPPKTADDNSAPTNQPPGVTADTNPVPPTPPPVPPPVSNPPPVVVVPPPPVVPPAPPVVPAAGSVYVIVQGDTLGAIAHKNGVSLKALEEANPGVDPKKLQIGQKLQIPGSTAPTSATPTDNGVGGDTTTYTIKPGDVLIKIAKTHGTTVKEIMKLNGMTSTSIKAGQKIKLPAPKTPEVAPAPAATAPPATAPATPATPATPAQ